MVSCSFLRNNEKYFLAEGINKRKTYLKVCMRRSILEAARIFFLMTALRSASIPWCSGAAGVWGSALSSSSPHTFRITTKLSTTTERTGLSYISKKQSINTFLSNEGDRPSKHVHEIWQPVWVRHMVELAYIHHLRDWCEERMVRAFVLIMAWEYVQYSRNEALHPYCHKHRDSWAQRKWLSQSGTVFLCSLHAFCTFMYTQI